MMFSPPRFLSLIALGVLSLGVSGCAYFQDTSIETVTVETLGAENAECTLIVERIRYGAIIGQPVDIKKSRKPMTVDCKAPGGRRVTQEIPAGITKTAYNNVYNFGLGLPWDIASDSIYEYPDIIVVDFNVAPLNPNGLPKHYSPDIPDPADYNLEEYLPRTPRLNSDKLKPEVEIRQREQFISRDQSFDLLPVEQSLPASEKGGSLSPAQQPVRIPEQAGGTASSNGPTPLFPVE